MIVFFVLTIKLLQNILQKKEHFFEINHNNILI